jgi:hypothetical protein
VLSKRGIPAVVLVTERFVSLATEVLKSRGVDLGCMVTLPKTELTEYSDESVMLGIAEASVALILKALRGE